MAFAQTADSGVAGHFAYFGKTMRYQGRSRTCTPRCLCRIGPRMAAPDNDDIKMFHVKQSIPK
jgi:hypothetical protein